MGANYSSIHPAIIHLQLVLPPSTVTRWVVWRGKVIMIHFSIDQHDRTTIYSLQFNC